MKKKQPFTELKRKKFKECFNLVNPTTRPKVCTVANPESLVITTTAVCVIQARVSSIGTYAVL